MLPTLHNLVTGESRILSESATITFEELLLTSAESLGDLINLQTSWFKELPGQSHAVTTLRNDLIRTDWLRRRARTVLQQFQLELYLTGLPIQYWDRLVQQQIRFLEKHAAHTQNEFRKAFQLLQSLKPASSKPEEPPAPPKPQREYKPICQQTVHVRIVDGKIVTTTDLKPEEFIDTELMRITGLVWRNFYFYDGVPEEYAWAMHHKGVDYGPTKSILICYPPEEFREICVRELATKSEFVLDGKRNGYRHRPHLPLLES